MKSLPNITSVPTKTLFEDKIVPEKTTDHWYHPPNVEHRQPQHRERHKFDWKGQITKLEALFRENKLGDFHKLVNKITKIRNSWEPIQNLNYNGQTIHDQ